MQLAGGIKFANEGLSSLRSQLEYWNIGMME